MVENLGSSRVSTFIRHMWISRYGDVKSQSLYREIREQLEQQKVGSVEFTKQCAQESEYYAAITTVNAQKLGEQASKSIGPLVQAFEIDQPLPVLLSGLICLESTEFEKLARTVLTVVTRHSVIANLNPGDLENALYSAARAIREEFEISHQSTRALKAAKDILSRINPSQEQIRTAVQDLRLSRRQAGYILTALAEKSQTQTKAVEVTRNSIEHIFPENASEDEWPDAEVLSPFIWHIGNLTLLEETYNRAAGNKKFASKTPLYTMSELNLTKEIPIKYQEWNADTIRTRATSLVPLIGQIWPELL